MHWQSLEFIMLVKLGILKFFFLFNILDERSQDFKTDDGQCFRTVQKTMTVTTASHFDRHFQPREAHGLEFTIEHHDRIQV